MAEGLAGVVAAVNRVDEVYENDFAIHMTLVANNDQLIFPLAVNGGSQRPFRRQRQQQWQWHLASSPIESTHSSDRATTISATSSPPAAVAWPTLAWCATTNYKGGGTTGLTNGALLSTDVFYIDYVAHEMGHQFGGNHTFNGSNGSCGGGNRNGGTAYEPGSGSTIMAYAGICGPSNNLQPHSDPYFHAASLDEINTYTNASTGSTCGSTAANNTPPAVTPLDDYSIPAGYAVRTGRRGQQRGAGAEPQFRLGGIRSGSGQQQLWKTIRAAGRSSARSTRRPGSLRAAPGRTVRRHPSVRRNPADDQRAAEFRRDGARQHGRRRHQPERTQPAHGNQRGRPVPGDRSGRNLDLVLRRRRRPGTVLWDVADTDLPPVSCPLVNIDLTTTADFDAVTPLASGVPNSGSALVDVPNVLTSTARVRVKCANNIFFSISPADFTIAGSDMIFVDGFEQVP